ncbi:MAG: hypothetical protein CFE32_23345, partial [Alphaproteobacteria bacterium PA3]
AGVTTDASVTSHAVFGEVYIDITPELSVLGGIRYTKDDKSIRTASGTFALGPFFEGEASFDAWTGRGSVTWQPTPDNNLYLTFSRGFKSGGFNPGNVGTPPFDSEFINSWELGSKNTLLDSKLTLNGALFQYDYSNLIVGNIVGTLPSVTPVTSGAAVYTCMVSAASGSTTAFLNGVPAGYSSLGGTKVAGSSFTVLAGGAVKFNCAA